MAKHSHGSASQGEPRSKKARKGSEAEASMPEVVPSGAEKQEEKEEEEEEEVRSRGPALLAEGESVGEPVMAEEVERPEVDLVGRDDVEISGVSTQPGPSSPHERRVECNNPGPLV